MHHNFRLCLLHLSIPHLVSHQLSRIFTPILTLEVPFLSVNVETVKAERRREPQNHLLLSSQNIRIFQ